MSQQNIELQKIAILDSSYQGWFNFKVSLVAGLIVSSLILIATVRYENIINVDAMLLAYLIVGIVSFFLVRGMINDHNDHIDFMNDLLIKVENGDKLESLKELRRMKIDKARNKPKERMQKLKAKSHGM